MATFETFEEIEAWKEARMLANKVFILTEREYFKKDFSLVNQIRASSGSVMDNIAEGFERDGRKEFINFLSISKGSAGEVRSQLYRAFDRRYISEEELNNLSLDCRKVSKLISGLMSYLRKSDLTGTKFKT